MSNKQNDTHYEHLHDTKAEQPDSTFVVSRVLQRELQQELLILLIDYGLRKFDHREFIVEIINLFRKYKGAL